ncbi:MAG TPA: nuclear transport factor 2 family protein [Acidobacteriaceae bacterium]|nr:nuclear transport factor 2 family protein [Acidobacteriaceae bacterium]
MDERLDVMNVVASLALFVDALRWNDLRSIFTAEVRLDYTSLLGGEARRRASEDLITAWQELLPGFTHTQHLIGAVRVSVTDGFAYVEAPVMGWHIIRDETIAGRETWTVGGRYEMEIERHNGEWRIAALTLAGAWAEGNLDLAEQARERVRSGRGRQTEG